MAVLSLVLAIFFATYSLPTEMESKIAYTVMTKPVGRAEVVAGKTLGMSLVILAAVGLVGAAAYIYINIRATSIHSLAQARLEEVRTRTAFPADLAALQGVADRGPLQTYRYLIGTSGMPVLGVDLGSLPYGPPDTEWILGETGAHLQWEFGQTPLREWVAGAPGGSTCCCGRPVPPTGRRDPRRSWWPCCRSACRWPATKRRRDLTHPSTRPSSTFRRRANSTSRCRAPARRRSRRC